VKSPAASVGLEVVLLARLPAEDEDVARPCLQAEGFDVRGTPGLEEGLRLVGAGGVDLVVVGAGELDAELEGFLGAIRSARGPGRLPVIAVAPRFSFELVRELDALGVADILNRPLVPEDLARRAREALREAGRKAVRPGGSLPGDRSAPEGLTTEILAAIAAWVLVVDPGMRIVFANRAFASALGMKPEELTGADLGAALLPAISDVDRVIGLVKDALSGVGDARGPYLQFRDGTGDLRIVDVHVLPIPHRGLGHALLVLHDVTGHWFAERAVERERRKLEDIVNGLGASLAVVDRALVVRWANRSFVEWFGPLWGKRFDLALRGFSVVGDTDPSKVFAGREHVSREWVFFTPDGDRRYYRNIVVPSRDASGVLRELVVVTQDLTGMTLRSEQHRLLTELGNLLHATLDLHHLLYIILTCSTAGHALGFNRAFVFLVDEGGTEVRGEMAVGPATREEAFVIWGQLAGTNRGLAELTADYESFRGKPQPLTDFVRRLRYRHSPAVAEREIVVRTCLEHRTQTVRDAGTDPRVSGEFREFFRSREFVCVPLRGKRGVLGVLLADNVFTERSLSAEQVSMLELFASAAGLALDNARTYADLKSSLDRLREAQAALIHSERLATIGQVAANVAHEIRNPLVTIGGFARSILKRSGDEARARESAEIIVGEVSRLEAILSEIMDFTKPAMPVLKRQPVGGSLERVATVMGPEAAAMEAEIAVETDPGLPEAEYDEKQIHQVLMNLVRNSLEAMAEDPRPGQARRVLVRARFVDGEIRVEVEDTGPGIPLSIMPRLFEPFFSRKEHGTGLGLAVVRKILHDHGGDVSARNAPGGGALFTLRLPEAGRRTAGEVSSM
jgi:PAS domain S-box-containing protein